MPRVPAYPTAYSLIDIPSHISPHPNYIIAFATTDELKELGRKKSQRYDYRLNYFKCPFCKLSPACFYWYSNYPMIWCYEGEYDGEIAIMSGNYDIIDEKTDISEYGKFEEVMHYKRKIQEVDGSETVIIKQYFAKILYAWPTHLSKYNAISRAAVVKRELKRAFPKDLAHLIEEYCSGNAIVDIFDAAPRIIPLLMVKYGVTLKPDPYITIRIRSHGEHKFMYRYYMDENERTCVKQMRLSNLDTNFAFRINSISMYNGYTKKSLIHDGCKLFVQFEYKKGDIRITTIQSD